MRSKPAIALSVLVALVPLGLLGSASASSAPPHTATTDITRLFPRAVALVRAKPRFAKAVVLEADGLPSGPGAVTSAAKITGWRFVFATSDGKTPTVTLDYSRSAGFAKPVGHSSPFLEDAPIRMAPAMTLTRAVSLLERAGHSGGFYSVTLRSPLGPTATPPLYIFSVTGGRYFAVNTKTGKVAPLS